MTADDLAGNSVRSDEVADGQVRTQEIGNGQVQAEDLAAGVAPGASGARAWGLVTSLGNLPRSKHVTGVTNPENGVFCIDPGPGIDPDTAVILFGEDISFSETSAPTDNMSHTEWDSDPQVCPRGAMEVETFTGFGTAPSNSDTDIGGIDMFAHSHGFTFVIP